MEFRRVPSGSPVPIPRLRLMLAILGGYLPLILVAFLIDTVVEQFRPGFHLVNEVPYAEAVIGLLGAVFSAFIYLWLCRRAEANERDSYLE